MDKNNKHFCFHEVEALECFQLSVMRYVDTGAATLATPKMEFFVQLVNS